MTCTNPVRERQINQRLEAIHHRLKWIADTESNAARVGGVGADGRFDPERSRLVAETDRLLDELTAIGGRRPFGRRLNPDQFWSTAGARFGLGGQFLRPRMR